MGKYRSQVLNTCYVYIIYIYIYIYNLAYRVGGHSSQGTPGPPTKSFPTKSP